MSSNLTSATRMSGECLTGPLDRRHKVWYTIGNGIWKLYECPAGQGPDQTQVAQRSEQDSYKVPTVGSTPTLGTRLWIKERVVGND